MPPLIDVGVFVGFNIVKAGEQLAVFAENSPATPVATEALKEGAQQDIEIMPLRGVATTLKPCRVSAVFVLSILKFIYAKNYKFNKLNTKKLYA